MANITVVPKLIDSIDGLIFLFKKTNSFVFNYFLIFTIALFSFWIISKYFIFLGQDLTSLEILSKMDKNEIEEQLVWSSL